MVHRPHGGMRASQRELSLVLVLRRVWSCCRCGGVASECRVGLCESLSGMVRICISWGRRCVLPPDFGWPDSKEVQQLRVGRLADQFHWVEVVTRYEYSQED